MTEEQRKKGENEAAFRAANERLETSARDIVEGDDERLLPFLCECMRPECRTVVLVTIPEYEYARGNSLYGLLAVGHEDTSMETVLKQTDRYILTEKFGDAAVAHDALDPRS